MSELPVLWHLKVSNFNEKARWALDFKRVPHVRRAELPGPHARIARRLTGGTTFPVLELDGKAIGESSAIVAALERRHPEPPLYPAGADERRRALELEALFDAELGPSTRLLVIDSLLAEPALMLGAFAPDLSPARRALARAVFPRTRRRTVRALGIDRDAVARAYERIAAIGERVRAEVGPSGYLAGDAFSVADLTLAALASPAVCPLQFPYPQPQRDHEALAPVRAALADAGIAPLCREHYARHRGASAEVAEHGGEGARLAAGRPRTVG